MRRFSILAISGIVMLLLAAFLGSATSQQKTLKDQLVGAWTLVSIDYVRADGLDIGETTRMTPSPHRSDRNSEAQQVSDTTEVC